MLTGSQPMRAQTCLAYSSSIQGSSSPHQRVERDEFEVAVAVEEDIGEVEGRKVSLSFAARCSLSEYNGLAGGGEGWWWLKREKDAFGVEEGLGLFGPVGPLLSQPCSQSGAPNDLGTELLNVGNPPACPFTRRSMDEKVVGLVPGNVECRPSPLRRKWSPGGLSKSAFWSKRDIPREIC